MYKWPMALACSGIKAVRKEFMPCSVFDMVNAKVGSVKGFVVDLAADLEEVHWHLAGLVHLAPGSLHITVGGTEGDSFGAKPTMHVVLAPS
jgi:hypothetical protein